MARSGGQGGGRSSLKFRGRTPSRFGAGPDARLMGGEALRRGHQTRARAWKIFVLCLVLSVLVTLLRATIGDNVPWPAARALRIWNNAGFTSSAKMQSVVADGRETLLALPVWGGEWMQRLDPQEIGVYPLLWLLGLLGVAVGAWKLAARRRRTRTPSLLWTLLLVPQVLAALYYSSSFRAPLRRLNSAFVPFDFHAHSTRSNGLLTPQQQINWHRARGFRGLAFTEANQWMSASTLAALRTANPDMILLGGYEFQSREAHLLFFALKAPPFPSLDLKAAVREAKQQGALVIVAHPWSAQLSAAQLAALPVDGFEAWNGVVGEANLARQISARAFAVTGATDSGSKSGADCYVWNLLPTQTQTPAQVLGALRARKIGVASALTKDETAQSLDERRQKAKSAGMVWRGAREAWSKLSRAQRFNVLLQVLAGVSVLVFWGAREAIVVAPPTGPTSAMSFLRRRRLVLRLCGALLMVLAFVGSLAVAVVAFGGQWKSVPQAQNFTPLHAIFAWILLDAGCWWGCKLWKRVH